MYDGENTPKEHAEEAARLGGADAYRVRMVNALLGVVQAEAEMADGANLDEGAYHAAWEEQLKAAGAGLEDPARRMEFTRWQVLRAGTPLRLMAQNREVGSIPLAAAHAAAGLHLLLGVDRREPECRRQPATWRPWPPRPGNWRPPGRHCRTQWTTPTCC